MKVFAVLALLVCAVSAKSAMKLGAFSWSSCNANDPIQATSLSVSPDPISIPGTVTVSITVAGTQDVVSPTEFDILMERNVNGAWVEVPCLDNIGSCDDVDICASLATNFPDGAGCPAAIVASGLNCNCPISAGSYSIDGLEITVDVAPPSNIVDGSYHVQVTANDAAGNQLTCLDIYADVVVSA